MNKERIIQDLLDRNLIQIGETINYKRFKQIHASGYSHIKEYYFAEILGIHGGNFSNVKNKGQNAIVLKELIPMQEEQLAQKVVEELLSQVEPGQRIDYEHFFKLKEPYPDISEAKFAKFLELNRDAMYRLRKGKDAAIFASRFNPESMTELLIQEGIALPGAKISYDQFLQIYDTAREKHPSLSHFSQYAFAKLLGIRKSTFGNFKHLKPPYLQILKHYMAQEQKASFLSADERMIIVQDLMNHRGAKPYEFCNYSRFQELYAGYEQFSEYHFALILDLSNSCFSQIKNQEKKLRILKDCFNKESVISEILASGKLQIGQKLDYQKFCEVYQNYKYLDVSFFAEILDISEGTLERLQREKNATTIVFKSRIKETPQPDFKKQAQTYVKDLFYHGKIHIGQEIDYKQFQEIYSPCSSISEFEFAALLGISYFKYQNMRFMGSKTYIHDAHVLESIQLMGEIEQQRFYTKVEIENMCDQYQITQEDFIRYIIYKGNLKGDIHAYIDALNAHNHLYIGKTRMSNSYFENNYNEFIDPIRRLVGSMCKKYHYFRHLDDYQSDALLYILENCGDIEMNLYDCEDKKVITYMLVARARFFLLDKIVGDLKLDSTKRSTSHYYIRRDDKRYDIPDPHTNVEEKAIDFILDETTEAKIMR